MKTSLLRMLSTLAAGLILASCQIPLSLKTPVTGTGSVHLEVSSGRTVVASLAAPDHYEVTLTQTGYTSLFKSVSSGSSIDIPSVPMGTWTVTVVAKTAAPANQTLASGSAPLVLTTANQTVNQTVVLTFGQTAAGLGSFRLPVQFNAATGIDFLSAQIRLASASTWTDLGPLALTTSGGVSTATVASASLASGVYQLLLTFRRGGATGASAGSFGEAVNIWDNITSDQWMDPADGSLKTVRAFGDGEFFSSNANLAGLSVQSCGASVVLTPGFASGVTAYSLLTASPVLTLFATGSVAGQALDYRIGSGAWTAVTSTSGSGEITVTPGTEAVSLRVTAPDRTTQKTYSLTQGLRLGQTALAMVPGFSGPFFLTAGPGSPSVTWSTSNGSVAAVSASGAVTAVGSGTATVTATVNGVSADCTVTVGTTVALGTVGPAGGLIYFDQGNNNDGWHYLEAAPSDQADAVRWSPLDTTGTTVATVGIVGQGDSNTTAILAACGTSNGTNYAAAIARAYTLGGFTDWYLPTTNEQYALFETPALGMTGSYWSSEALDASNAWWRAKTVTSNKSDTSALSASAKVRAVRKVSGLWVPQNVKAYGGSGTFRVTWDPVAGATSYTVSWKAGSTLTTTDSGVTVEPSQTACPIDLGGKTNGTTYAALVVANFAGYSGASSAVAKATPSLTLPTVNSIDAADGTVTLNCAVYPGATSYAIMTGGYWPTLQATSATNAPKLTGQNNTTSTSAWLVATTASGSFLSPRLVLGSDPAAPANLLTNPMMAGYATNLTSSTSSNGWTFSPAGSGWFGGAGSLNYFTQWTSSYVMESFSQTVDLTTKGFTLAQLGTPGATLTYSVWEGMEGEQGGNYYLTLELLDASNAVLDTVSLGSAGSPLNSDLALTRKGLTYVNSAGKAIKSARVTTGGCEATHAWGGAFGASFAFPVLTASVPPMAVSDNGAVLLSWAQPTQPTSATGYKIYRSTTSGSLGTVVATIASGTTLTYRDTGLTNGTTYYFTVAPVFASGATAVGVQVPATPVHQEFFIANYGSNTIDINAETTSGSAGWVRTRTANGAGKAVGTGPANFAVDATGKYLYVSNATASADYGVKGYLVDLTTGDIPGSAVGVGASGIAAEGLAVAAPASAGGKQFLYATYPGANSVQAWEINSSGALVSIANYAAGTTPRHLSVTPNGKFLYATNIGSSTVSAYAVNANGTLTSINSYSGNGLNQPFKGCIDPSGTWLYVANFNGANVSQFLINANGTLTPANYYAANTTPTDIEIDSSGLHAYVTAAGSGGNVVQLYTMNPSTGVLTWVANYPCSGYTSAVSIDLTGSYLVVPDGLTTNRYDVFAIDPFAGRLTLVATQDTANQAAEVKFLRLN